MTIFSLWLPILVTAVVVFVAGAVIWMAMPWHKTDWSKTADEEAVREGVQALAGARPHFPGLYVPTLKTDAAYAAAVRAAREGGASGVALFGGVRAIPEEGARAGLRSD